MVKLFDKLKNALKNKGALNLSRVLSGQNDDSLRFLNVLFVVLREHSHALHFVLMNYEFSPQGIVRVLVALYLILQRGCTNLVFLNMDFTRFGARIEKAEEGANLAQRVWIAVAELDQGIGSVIFIFER